MKKALNDRKLDVREAKDRARNRNEWIAIVNQIDAAEIGMALAIKVTI